MCGLSARSPFWALKPLAEGALRAPLDPHFWAPSPLAEGGPSGPPSAKGPRAGGDGGPSGPSKSIFLGPSPLAEGALRAPLGQGAPDILSECPPLMAALIIIYRKRLDLCDIL